MRHILITGANRGIGLELVKLYLQQDDIRIFAACRKPDEAKKLQTLADYADQRVTILEMDVTDQRSINESVRLIDSQVARLDMLVNNAGIYPGGVHGRDASSSSFGSLEIQAMLHVFHVNTVAPVIVAQAFADLLRRGENARIINLSSDAGSLTIRDTGGNYSYPASKTALNMMTRCLSADFRADNVTVISIHPGWIQTDMGGTDAPRTLADTIPSMIRVVDNLTLTDSGKFFNWDGTLVPW